MKSTNFLSGLSTLTSGRSPQKGGRAPPTIPHSEVALIVNDIFDPMYGYHKGDENKAAEMKKRFLGGREESKSLVNPTVIVKKWSNCLTPPLKYLPIYIKIPQ